MYDKVRVYFYDNTSTIIHVSEDDNIEDEIVNLCETEGWDIQDVDGWVINLELGCPTVFIPMGLH